MILKPHPFRQNPVYQILRYNFQQTKTHLSITNLNHWDITSNPKILYYFLQVLTNKFRSTQLIRRLTLDLSEFRIYPKTISHLYKGLIKNLKYIENFKIILCPHHYIFDDLDFLLKTLRNFPYLKTFEIVLAKTSEKTFRKQFMKHVIKRLKKSAPRLKDLKITFLNHMTNDLELLKEEPELNTWGIKRLTNLHNLTLHLPRTAFLASKTEAEAKFDLPALRRFTKLKSLDIAIVDCSGQHRGGTFPKERFIFDPKKLFPNLRKFKWGLSENGFDEAEGFQLLRPSIASILPLEQFVSKFKQLWILNNTEIEALSQSETSGELISQGLDRLKVALGSQKLKEIESFCLELAICKGINNRSWAKFGHVIGQNMIALKSLRLCFERNQENSDGLSGALKNMFGEERITDEGLGKFGTNLAEKCGNLEFVWLEFESNEKISDRGVESLCEGLGKIESLKRVWLRFKWCHGVSMASGKLAKEKLGEKREVRICSEIEQKSSDWCFLYEKRYSIYEN